MRKSTLMFVIIMIFSAKVFATNLPDELLNIPIPLISGEHTTLATYNGKKPVYIKFWATWCQPCRKEMPHFEHVQNEYGELVEVIGINLGINDDIKAVENTVKEFGLTMGMAIDKNGDLAQAFRLIGTPYHLLFDRDMNLIHRGHEANESLDNKIALVSQVKTVDLLDANLLSEKESNVKIDLGDGKVHALFFTATWCDWYLKESRPEYSKKCVAAQNNINSLYKKYSSIVWNGVVSRLWTGDKDLLDYKKKYTITHPIEIDKSNRLFHQYSVKDFPTLILIKDNKVILKTTDLDDEEKLITLLTKYKID
ncbi:MAG: redoxin family protein [Woeseiaceae bacterium]